jgi:hypothetical protein
MKLVCPVCNGMKVYLLKCPICGDQMENDGPIQDFLDDYSPYLPISITQQVDGTYQDQCVHVFHCKYCNKNRKFKIQKIRM